MKYIELESAFDFKNFSGMTEKEVIINKKTGKSFLIDEDLPEEDDFDMDDFDESIHVYMPDKREINLGSSLVFKFASEYIPDNYGTIQNIFSKRGAYSKFKNYLDKIQRLETWYQFEREETEKALRTWCKDNEIKLED